MELTEAEVSLIKEIRQLNFGRILVAVKKGQPLRIEEVRKYTNLT